MSTTMSAAAFEPLIAKRAEQIVQTTNDTSIPAVATKNSSLEKEFEGNSWSELWRKPGNRHRLIILVSLGFFSQWSGNGLAR